MSKRKEADGFFDKISDELIKTRNARSASKREKDAIDWFIKKNGETGKGGRIDMSLIAKGQRSVTKLEPGQVFTYRYNSKLFEENRLPYFDAAPLVIFIDVDKHGNYLGLNLHYLPPVVRARILGVLMKTVTAKTLRHDTRMKINYQLVKQIAEYKPLQYCIKSYIPGRISTKIIRIQPAEWEKVVFLPLAHFVGASAHRVWSEGRRAKYFK